MTSAICVSPVRIAPHEPPSERGSGGNRSRSSPASRTFAGSAWATTAARRLPPGSSRSMTHQSVRRETKRSATRCNVGSKSRVALSFFAARTRNVWFAANRCVSASATTRSVTSCTVSTTYCNEPSGPW